MREAVKSIAADIQEIVEAGHPEIAVICTERLVRLLGWTRRDRRRLNVVVDGVTGLAGLIMYRVEGEEQTRVSLFGIDDDGERLVNERYIPFLDQLFLSDWEDTD